MMVSLHVQTSLNVKIALHCMLCFIFIKLNLAKNRADWSEC